MSTLHIILHLVWHITTKCFTEDKHSHNIYIYIYNRPRTLNNNNNDNNNTNKWNMYNPAPILENDTHKLQWDFNIQTDHLIPARRPDLMIINKKKRICKILDFAVPTDQRINLKECEKKDKYPDLARELKKLWNMKVTIVPIVIGALGTIAKWLLKGLEDLEVGGRVETIQMTALLRKGRILRRVLETWGDLQSLRLYLKTIS